MGKEALIKLADAVDKYIEFINSEPDREYWQDSWDIWRRKLWQNEEDLEAASIEARKVINSL